VFAVREIFKRNTFRAQKAFQFFECVTDKIVAFVQTGGKLDEKSAGKFFGQTSAVESFAEQFKSFTRKFLVRKGG